ncbi:TRAP transporter large permease subunit [Suttonella sp. R2A3]|uniref:TRAP transporter large permease n=1 Tax=Suttonella sp. R2A3 TaxID=2908648 RepID=UPI001F39A2B2|nr:TRAP transporter large permease subunit [Suttonella sp. R2A3]UJF24496.1 TRAP transporter large permease subunit [Suttonella sp. R2A3]
MRVLDKLEEWLGGSLFLLMFVILIAQIVARQLLDMPLIWSEEAARLIFVYVGMLGISIGIRNQQHVLVDFVCHFFSEHIRRWVFSLVQVLIFISIMFFTYYGFVLVKKASFTIVSLDISDKWLYLALPLGSILMLWRFIQAQRENYQQKITLIPAVAYGISVLVLLAIWVLVPSWFAVLNISQYVDLDQSAVYIALGVWLVIMFLGVPVGWSLFIATVLFFSMTSWIVGDFAAKKLVDSINSFSLLSVPFFILTGILMNSSGITTRIFNFARTMLGHYTGGMGHVNISASLVFSGMSGSALADAGGLGQLEIKAMRDEGYDDDLCGGITAASCIIGPLVPPSIAMIIYGVIANQSIAELFLAGFIPGVLLTVALMIMNAWICHRRGYPRAEKANCAARIEAFKGAFWALLTPIIIIGGIFSGYFTATEAAGVAALYSIVLGMLYRELSWEKLFKSCVEAMAISGVTVLMVMAVTFFGDMIAREQVAIKIAEGFMSVASSALIVLLMINLLLLFLGMFIDALALQFLVLPMLIPIAQHFNIDLIFFGVMTTLNMMIGILTPPMGMALFVVARVGNMPVSTVARGVLPFLVPIFVALILITLFPQIVTFLPNLLLAN